jgi:hypothetical protein
MSDRDEIDHSPAIVAEAWRLRQEAVRRLLFCDIYDIERRARLERIREMLDTACAGELILLNEEDET